MAATSSFRLRLVAAITRTSTFVYFALPDPLDLVRSMARRSLGCTSSELADLVEEDGAAVGLEKALMRLSTAPVKEPRSWPKSSLSSEVRRDGAAVDDHERALGWRRLCPVDGVGRRLLAGARLPFESTVASVSAARASRAKSERIGAERPTIPRKWMGSAMKLGLISVGGSKSSGRCDSVIAGGTRLAVRLRSGLALATAEQSWTRFRRTAFLVDS